MSRKKLENQNKEKKLPNKLEILSDVFWIVIAVFGFANSHSKEEFWICGIMVFIGVVYTIKVVKTYFIQIN